MLFFSLNKKHSQPLCREDSWPPGIFSKQIPPPFSINITISYVALHSLTVPLSLSFSLLTLPTEFPQSA